MDSLDTLRTSAQRTGKNALHGFLSISEVWEDRPEQAPNEILVISWVTGIVAFAGGLLTLYITSQLRHNNLQSFFWIHPIARFEHGLINGYHAISIGLVVLGVLGMVVAFFMMTSATGASTRYLVTGEALMVGGAVMGEAVLLFFFIVQLVLWIVVIGLVLAAAFAILASLGGG